MPSGSRPSARASGPREEARSTSEFASRDLTILAGENNGGKSNAIDALRLVTTPFSKRREIYCESTDIRFGSAERKFELDATFADLSVAQQGRLISAVTDHTLQKAVFGLSYDETKKSHPVRPTTWAGQFKSPPEAGCQDTIRHVYLRRFVMRREPWRPATRLAYTHC